MNVLYRNQGKFTIKESWFSSKNLPKQTENDLNMKFLYNSQILSKSHSHSSNPFNTLRDSQPLNSKTNKLRALTIIHKNLFWDNKKNTMDVYFPIVSNRVLPNAPSTPFTDYNIKKPEEKLKKGQNQLMIEKIHEKNNIQKIQNQKSRLFRTDSEVGTMKKKRSWGKDYQKLRMKIIKNKSRDFINVGISDELSKKKNTQKTKDNDIDIDNNANGLPKENGIEDKKENSDVNIIFDSIISEFKLKEKRLNGIKGKININKKNKSFDDFDKIYDIEEEYKKDINKIKNSKNSISNNAIGGFRKEGKLYHSHKEFHTLYQISLKRRFSFSKVNTIYEEKKQNKKRKKLKFKIEKEEIPFQRSNNTSSNFFRGNFKFPSSNINNIISRVLENNIKEAAAKSKEILSDLGKDFLNNHLRHTKRNFFTFDTARNFYSKEKREKYDNCKIKKEQPKTLNSLKIVLNNPMEWRRHEEIWINISTIFISPSEFETFLLPPNDNDVLISSFLKLYPSTLHLSALHSSKQDMLSPFSFTIDDTIKNPRSEIKKWKDAYKRMILRWHPDKLFPVLNEIKFKDENRKNLLKKKSTVIIYNMNIFYKQVLEILRKISLNKN